MLEPVERDARPAGGEVDLLVGDLGVRRPAAPPHRHRVALAHERLVDRPDVRVPLPSDRAGLVVLHDPLEILLGLHAEELLALGVLEHDLVEAAAARGRGAAPAALRLLARQPVGRARRAAEEAAHDHRLIGVAFEEGHQHLLPDARERHHPVARSRPSPGSPASSTSCSRRACPRDPSGTGPARGPARRCGSLPGRARHHRALDALDRRLRRAQRRPVRRVGERGARAHRPLGVGRAVDGEARDEERVVVAQIGARVVLHGDHRAGREPDQVGLEEPRSCGPPARSPGDAAPACCPPSRWCAPCPLSSPGRPAITSTTPSPDVSLPIISPPGSAASPPSPRGAASPPALGPSLSLVDRSLVDLDEERARRIAILLQRVLDSRAPRSFAP